MTGRLSAPLAVVSLVSSAILASGCVFAVDRGPRPGRDVPLSLKPPEPAIRGVGRRAGDLRG